MALVCKNYYDDRFLLHEVLDRLIPSETLQKAQNRKNGVGRSGKRSVHYKPRGRPPKEEKRVEGECVKLDILERLISPIRREHEFGKKNLIRENWTLKEMAVFECAICRFGKRFDILSKMVGSKSALDCTAFYREWKKSSHYKIWKDKKDKIRGI